MPCTMSSLWKCLQRNFPLVRQRTEPTIASPVTPVQNCIYENGAVKILANLCPFCNETFNCLVTHMFNGGHFNLRLLPPELVTQLASCRQFDLSDCSFSDSASKTLLLHLRSRELPLYWKALFRCHKCGEVFDSVSILISHLGKCTPTNIENNSIVEVSAQKRVSSSPPRILQKDNDNEIVISQASQSTTNEVNTVDSPILSVRRVDLQDSSTQSLQAWPFKRWLPVSRHKTASKTNLEELRPRKRGRPKQIHRINNECDDYLSVLICDDSKPATWKCRLCTKGRFEDLVTLQSHYQREHNYTLLLPDEGGLMIRLTNHHKINYHFMCLACLKPYVDFDTLSEHDCKEPEEDENEEEEEDNKAVKRGNDRHRKVVELPSNFKKPQSIILDQPTSNNESDYFKSLGLICKSDTSGEQQLVSSLHGNKPLNQWLRPLRSGRVSQVIVNKPTELTTSQLAPWVWTKRITYVKNQNSNKNDLPRYPRRSKRSRI